MDGNLHAIVRKKESQGSAHGARTNDSYLMLHRLSDVCFSGDCTLYGDGQLTFVISMM
jgi:hypothetical protein